MAECGDVILFREPVRGWHNRWNMLFEDARGEHPQRYTLEDYERKAAFAYLRQHGRFPDSVGDAWYMSRQHPNERITVAPISASEMMALIEWLTNATTQFEIIFDRDQEAPFAVCCHAIHSGWFGELGLALMEAQLREMREAAR
jgi:hypothetical protein